MSLDVDSVVPAKLVTVAALPILIVLDWVAKFTVVVGFVELVNKLNVDDDDVKSPPFTARSPVIVVLPINALVPLTDRFPPKDVEWLPETVSELFRVVVPETVNEFDNVVDPETVNEFDNVAALSTAKAPYIVVAPLK